MKNQETKHSIVAVTENSMSELNSPTTTHILNRLAQGSTQSHRIGNSVMPVGIDIRGYVHSNSTGSGNLTRILVIQKNSPSDAFNNDGLEDNAGNFSPAARDVSSIFARVNTDKYRVLKNYVINTVGSNAGDYFKTFKMWVPLKGVMKYDDDALSCQNRDIILVAWTREPNNDDTTSQCELTFNSKFYFKDA